MRFPLLALAAAWLAASPALASSVVIWPIDPKIAAGERATALWLENSGAEPITLQVRSFVWSQDEGGDRLTDQDEIVASPPMVEIAPGTRQLVRVIRRTIRTDAAERSYRIFVDEVPTSAPDLAPGEAGARLSVQMRYSIPLFTYGAPEPRGAAGASLRMGVRNLDGTRHVEITNTGDRHVRLTDLRSGSDPAGAILRQGLLGYVLPGATMRWPIPAEATGSVFTVAVDGVPRVIAPSA